MGFSLTPLPYRNKGLYAFPGKSSQVTQHGQAVAASHNKTVKSIFRVQSCIGYIFRNCRIVEVSSGVSNPAGMYSSAATTKEMLRLYPSMSLMVFFNRSEYLFSNHSLKFIGHLYYKRVVV